MSTENNGKWIVTFSLNIIRQSEKESEKET